jgi:hypothetical protein
MGNSLVELIDGHGPDVRQRLMQDLRDDRPPDPHLIVTAQRLDLLADFFLPPAAA